MKPLIVDALASGKGIRKTTRDVIGTGPRTIAGVLEVKGYEPKIIPVEQYLKLKKTEYDMLLVSGMTSDILAIHRTIRKWGKQNKGPILIGGPVTSQPVKVLQRTKADIAVIGEGEEALNELLEKGLQDGTVPSIDLLSSIRGIAFKTHETPVFNPLRPVQNRDIFKKYPASTRTIIDYPLFHAARVYVEVVRGCSNFHRTRIGPIGEQCTYCEQCTEGDNTQRYNCPQTIPPGCGYCSVPSLYGPSKTRPSSLVLKEVKELIEYGAKRFVLSAPGFLDYGREQINPSEPLTDPRSPQPNYEAIEELLSSLTALPSIRDGSASLMLENMKAGLVTEKAAKVLGRYLSGTPVSVGFETGSDEHSRQLGRPDTPSETLIAMRRLKRAGLKPYVYFIHGLPGQNQETTDKTVKMIKRSKQEGADRIILYRFQSLPMSAFTDCPSGPPATKDKFSRQIYDAAQEANKSSKMDLIGRRLKVVVAEVYDRDRRLMVGYPMKHGPVVLIEDALSLESRVVDVEVMGVVSDRMVKARVLTLS